MDSSLDPLPAVPLDAPLPQQKPSEIAPSEEPDHRRNGKVARLPKTTRDQINQLLQDGVPYLQLIKRLNLEQFDINEDHLYTWKKGGYLDWLHRDEWLAQMRSQVDFANDVLSQESNPCLHQANLQIAATQLIQNLISSGKKLLADEPQTYIRMVTVLCRLSREALAFEKYRQACTQARAKLDELLNPKRSLSDEERAAIVHQVDQILGLK